MTRDHDKVQVAAEAPQLAQAPATTAAPSPAAPVPIARTAAPPDAVHPGIAATPPPPALSRLSYVAGGAAIDATVRRRVEGARPNAVIRRRVTKLKGSSGGWVTSLVRDQVFATKAEAQAAEAAALALAEANRKTSSRDHQPAPQSDDFDYPVASTAKGFSLRQSPNHDYPPRAGTFAGPVATTALGTYARSSMGDDVTEKMTTHQASKDPTTTTSQDAVMAKGGVGLKAAGISRNHKLADSNIAAVCFQMAQELIKLGGIDMKQQLALSTFANALGASPNVLLTAMTAAIQSPATMASIVKPAIDELSVGAKNLRFGDAQLNTMILWAFDPNRKKDGSMTPESDAIAAAVRNLAAAGLISADMATASTTPLKEKESGAAIASSMAAKH